jgi:hypothetical protein
MRGEAFWGLTDVNPEWLSKVMAINAGAVIYPISFLDIEHNIVARGMDALDSLHRRETAPRNDPVHCPQDARCDEVVIGAARRWYKLCFVFADRPSFCGLRPGLETSDLEYQRRL